MLDRSDEIRMVLQLLVQRRMGRHVIDVDGSRVVYDYGWGLVRASNTGPNLTIKAEALTEEKCNDIMNEIEETIKLFS